METQPKEQLQRSIGTLPDMTLYEAKNGCIGESYLRCYVWAYSEEQALAMAKQRFKAKSGGFYQDSYHENVQVRALMSQFDPPFATEVSDDGWSQKVESNEF